MTWAKGFPANWNPFVSSSVETESGWQLRDDGSSGTVKLLFLAFAMAALEPLPGLGQFSVIQTTWLPEAFPTGRDGKWHIMPASSTQGRAFAACMLNGQWRRRKPAMLPDILASAEHLCIGAKDSSPGKRLWQLHHDVYV